MIFSIWILPKLVHKHTWELVHKLEVDLEVDDSNKWYILIISLNFPL